MTALLGIDCATAHRKTGLALGELRGGVVHILKSATGTSKLSPASIAVDWLTSYDSALIAIDAPLGWPLAMGTALAEHRAGAPIPEEANALFRRITDAAIKKRLGKQPLDVGSNFIARTAHAALGLLQQIRRATGRPIPLAWAPEEDEPWRAIEVYPAATRIAYGAAKGGGSLVGLEALLDCSAITAESDILTSSADAADAAVCALAAADFFLGRAVPPEDRDSALREGWIWTAAKEPRSSGTPG